MKKNVPSPFASEIDWKSAFAPLIDKYREKKHPLNYQNVYQLVVMTILSARSSDSLINSMAPGIFERFPDFESIANADRDDLMESFSGVINFSNKASWIIGIAQHVVEKGGLPDTLADLIKLPGIGRKSANVILRERGLPAEGVIVDLHVQRVVPRLGLEKSERPEKLEPALMQAVDQSDWGQIGMAISFLGRETCRPKNPKCAECIVSSVCEFFQTGGPKMNTNPPKENTKKGIKTIKMPSSKILPKKVPLKQDSKTKKSRKKSTKLIAKSKSNRR